MRLSSLIVLHFGSNVGYAIEPLERLLFEIATELAAGDEDLVHFAYPNFARGRPGWLHERFANFLEFQLLGATRDDFRRLGTYVRENAIKFVFFFDIHPVHPVIRYLRRSGAKTIITQFGSPMSSMMPKWKLLMKRLQVRFSRSRVDCVVFQSEAMADLGRYGRGLPENMIDVVPTGVDIDLFRPIPQANIHERFGFEQERRIVIYAGHVAEHKGVSVLISAATELLNDRGRKDVCFLLCGNKMGQETPYEAVYAGTEAERHIRFGGYLHDLHLVYPDCFCGVVPSTAYDSFPRAAIEMAACGLPVLGSRLQGLKEAVLHKKTGLLFEPGNSRELANLIEAFLDSPEEARRLGRAGRKRCELELNREKHMQHLLSVFRRRIAVSKAFL